MVENYNSLSNSGSAGLNNKKAIGLGLLQNLTLKSWQKKAFLAVMLLLSMLTGQRAFAQTYLTESFENAWYLNGNSSTAANATGPNAPSGWIQTRVVNNVASAGSATSGAHDWAQTTYSGSAYASNTPPLSAQAPYGGNPGTPPAGSGVMWFFDGGTSSGNTRRMESPSINLTSATGPVLSFSYSYAQSSTALTVIGSLDGGVTWSTLSTLALTTSTVWVSKVITLPDNYKIANAKIGFQIASQWGGYDVFIDNVSVREGTVPTAAPTSLANTLVTTTSMTLGWIDSSTNETGFRVFRSTDNVNFAQIGADITSTSVATTGNAYSLAQTGLTAGVTYYYKVSAYIEGNLSSTVVSQATTAGATYYWVGPTGSNWGTSGNWNTNPAGGGTTRATALTTDVLIVDGAGFVAGGAMSISVDATSFSIGQFKVTNNTTLTLASSAATQRKITITGGPNDDFVIENGSSLLLTNTASTISFLFSGTGNTGNIAGVLTIAGTSATANSANSFITTGGTGTVVTIASTGVINNTATTNITTNGNFTGSVATLVFANGSQYNVSGATTAAPWIPLATWGASSNLTISGLTSSSTAPTNNVQSFGNFTYNCPAATGTMSFFTTSTTAVIQGNLTITATNTGIFRALTSGTLTVNGNLIVNGGTLQSASSTGTLIVLGNTTIGASGKIDILAGTYSQRGTTFTNDGVLTGTGGTLGFLNFAGSASQTLAGVGSVAANLGAISMQNTAGLSITHTVPIPVLRVNLFQGTITGSDKITLGTGAAAAAIVQIGSAGLTTPGGSFAAIPTFNLGTGSYSLIYAQESVSRTIGNEIPATRIVSALTTTNSNGLILSGGNLATGTLTFGTATGNITTTSSNLLTVTGTTTGSIVRTSATAYVNGPLALTLPASLVSGSTYTFPIGKGTLNPFALVNPTTNAGGTVTVMAEAFDANAGGTPGTLMGALNTNRYWAASIAAGSGNFTDTLLQLSDTPAGADAIGASATQSGAYDLVGGLSTTTTASSLTTTAPAITSLPGYYVMGNKAAASLSALAITPTGNQCTNVARTVTVTVTPGGAAITSVVINYSIAGVAQTAITMTNLTGNDWSGTIPTVVPVNGAVTWSVTATDANLLTKSQSGTGYTDAQNTGLTVAPSATLPIICNGNATVLRAALSGNGLAVIGAGASTSSTSGGSMFPGNYGGAKTQYLVTAAELTALGLRAGNITSLAFEATTAFSGYEGFALNIGQTSLTSLAFPMVSTGLTQVYSGAGTNGLYATTLGVNTLTFSSPFNWDGTSSIVLSFCWAKNPTATSTISTTVKVDATSPSYVCSLYGLKDSTLASIMCPFTATADFGTSGTGTSRPKFTFAGVVDITPTAYSWSDGSSVMGTSNNLSVTPTATTTYTPTLTYNSCPMVGAGVTITVNPLPSAPTGTNSAQCGTQLATALVADPNGFTTPTYKWYAASSGGVALQSDPSTTYLATVATTTTFYVSVVNPTTSCESPRTAVTVSVSAPAVIDVSPAPTVAICVGESVSLDATSLNEYEYTWTANTATGSGVSGPLTGAMQTVTPTLAGTYIYTITGTEPLVGGCIDVQTVTVTVNPLPTISSALASASTICSGTATTLTALTPSIATGNITLGAGGTTSSSVADTFFPGSWGGAKTQYIIKASELTALNLSAGAINSLGFVAVSVGQTYQGFTVQMGATSATVLTSTFLNTAMTQVYKGTLTDDGFLPVVGTNTLAFGTGSGSSSSFTWDGSSNIVVSICWSSVPNASTSTSTSLKVDGAGFVCAAYDRTDSVSPAVECATTVGDGTGSNRPQFIINGQTTTSGAGSLTWTWMPGSLSGNSVSVSPSTTTLYTVTALNSATGCSNTATVNVNVNPAPAAPTAHSSAQCGTQVPTAYVTDVNGFTTPTYNWYADALTSTALQSSTSVTYTSSIAATTTFYVTVVNPSSLCESTRTPVTVTVNSPTAVSIAALVASTLCSGTSFSPAATSANDPNYTYVWTASPALGSGIATSVTGANPTITPTAAGTYIYTVTATDSAAGCVATNTVSVTSVACPIALATTSLASLCEGGNVILTATTSISSIPATYTAPPAVSNPTSDEDLANVTITAVAGGATVLNNTTAINTLGGTLGTATGTAGSYSDFTAFGPYGITAGADYNYALSSVQEGGNYNNIFGLWIDYNRDGDYADAGEQVAITTSGAGDITQTGTFTVPATAFNGLTRMRVLSYEGSSVSGPTQAAGYGEYEEYALNISSTYNGGGAASVISSYSWSDGSTVVGTTNPVTITPSATKTYTATLVSAGASFSSNGVVVTVNPLPTAPSTTASIQCGTVIPTASVADGNGFVAPTFKWYADNSTTTALQTATATTYLSPVAATTTFYVSVVNPTTLCESTRTAVTVTVNASDSIAITPSSASFCFGGSFAPTASSTNLGYVYTWTASPALGSGIATSVTGATPTITPTVSGTYIYMVSGTDGVCTNSNTVTVTVNALPAITTATATASTICVGGSSILEATALNYVPGNATVGAGATTSATYSNPFYSAWSNNHTQHLITAAELHSFGLSAGNINSIALNVTSAGSLPMLNLSIKIGTSAATNLTAFTSNAGFASVYTNASYMPTSGVNTFTFSTPFNWDGTSNLVVEFCHGNSGSTSTMNRTVLADATSYESSVKSQVSAATSAATICADTTTNLISYFVRPQFIFNGITEASLASTYDWTWNPGALTGASVSVSPASTTVYTVRATNPVTLCYTEQTVTVTVDPLATAPTATASSQCGAAIPTASVADGNGYTTPIFKWYADNVTLTALQAATTTTYATSIAATQTFYVSVVNPVTGCESTRTPVTVTVSSPDAISISAASSVCLGASLSPTASSSASYTYTWTASPAVGSGIATSLTGANPTITPTVAGTYVYTVSGTDGSCTTMNTVSVTVNALPTVPTITESSASLCTDQIGTLTAAVPSAANSYAFVSTSGGALETITAPTVVTTVLNGSLDDGSNLVTPSPAFTFNFTGTNYSSVVVNTNGWLKFGSTVPSINIPSSLTGIVNDAVYAFGRDASLNVANGGDMTHGYTTGGKYVIQFTKNSGGASGADSATNLVTMQIVLWGSASASPGKIEIIYDTSLSTPGSAGTIGIADAAGKYVNGVNGLTNSLATTSTYPSAGTVYTFTPPSSQITWTPTTGLYTDSGATTAYAGGVASTVYAKPTTTTAYTALNTNAASTCSASSLPKTITVNPLPIAPVASNNGQCGPAIPTTTTVSDPNGYTTPTFKWYLDNNPLTAVSQSSTATNYTTPISVTTTFYVSVVNPTTGCESTRTAVTATVASTPSATISYASPFCGTAVGATVTHSGTTTGTYSTNSVNLTVDASTGEITASAPGTYTVTYTMTGYCTTQIATASVVINAAPASGFTYAASAFCTGSATASPTITGTSGVFTATPAGLSINSVTGVIDFALSSAGSYTVTNTVSVGGCSDSFSTATVTINAAVAITTQPIGLSRSPGDTAAFTVAATGTGTLTYQWEVNSGSSWIPLTNAAPYTGVDTATLSVSDVSGLDTYQYHVIVTGTSPCAPLTSDNVTLTVNSITFTAQPVSQTICSTSGVTFTVATTGGTVSDYQWQYRVNSAGVFADILGAITDTYTIASGLTSANTGNQYRCVVNALTATPVNSAPGTLTVNDVVAMPTLGDLTVCNNASTATFTSNATGTGLTYQWEESTALVPAWTTISAATAASLVLNTPTVGMSTNQYRVVVTGLAPCVGLTSNAATLTVNPAVVISGQPALQSVCASATATYTVTATNGVSYQWYANNGSDILLTDGTLNGATFAGATAATLTIANPAYYNGYTFYCMVSGAASCSPLASSSALLTVNNKAVYAVGPGGDFTTLTAAISGIQACGISVATTLALNADYNGANEPAYPVVLPTISGASAANTITIQQATGVNGKVITNATVTPAAVATIDMNAGAYWIIDGRVGGSGTTKDLQITNSNLAGAAIRFINDATYNTVKYTDVSGVNNTITGGVVFFSTATTTGNDFNTIDNCNIRNAATNPVNGVYAAGTAAKINDNNTLSNNNIYDNFSATLATNGINVFANSGAWSITGNRLYQTSSRIYTTANTHNSINIATGDGYTITGNTIGFANASGTGTTNLIGNSVALTGAFPSAYTTTGTANATRYIAINAAFTAAGTVSNIQNNTIAGLALYTSSGAATANGVFCGINVTAGNVNIGTTTGNTIGATSGNSSIYVAATTTGAQVVGIYTTSANTVAIQNNTFGAIDASGTSATTRAGFTGIDTAGAANYSITNNTIGNADATNIRSGYFLSGANLTNNSGTATSTTGTTAFMMGIKTTMTGNVLAVTGNTLRGWATSGTVTPVTGISTSGAMTGTTPSVNVTTNSLGTSSRDFMTYSVANSGALAGISCTNTVATVHNVNGNDIRGIVHSVAGSSAHTYINLTGATAASNVASISNNTFTNLNVNTTGSVTFLSNSYNVAATGTQTINNNSIVTAFNKGSAGGTITLETSGASSTAGAVINHTNNNFSNITVTGATTIAGWFSTDGGTANKTYSGNTFSNWTGGSGSITAMSINYGGGNNGNGNYIYNNTISTITGTGIITGITFGATSGTLFTVTGNSITGLSSTGSAGAVTGIAAAGTTANVYSNIINTLSSTSTTATVAGITSLGATANIYSNTINTLSCVGSTSGITNGIMVTAGTTVKVYKNKVYDLLASGAFTTTGAVNGMVFSAGTTVSAYNNLVGDLRATAANSADAIRGISVTSTTANTSYNLYNNTIYLNATSSGAAFGTTGIFHAANATATTAKLDLQNNIVINTSTPGTTGVVTALRRGAAATMGNFATTSNRNMYFSGTAAVNKTIMYDGTNAYQTYATYFTAVGATREANSFVDTAFIAAAFFTATTGSSATYLQPNAVSTLAESGGNTIALFTDDYSGLTRPVTPGTAYDLGAWEFAGTSSAPAITFTSATPGLLLPVQCSATARVIAVNITASPTLVTLNYSYNGTAQTPIDITASASGTSYSGTIPAATPANATVAWSVTASNGASTTYTGTSYSDVPLTGAIATATASVSTLCAGSPTVLSAVLTKTGTATIGTGTSLTTAITQPTAFCNRWPSYRMQTVYTAAELQAAGLRAGNITSMAFNITTLGDAATNSGFVVKIGNTASTVLSGDFVSTTTGFTTVYPSQTYTHSASGLQTIPFSTPYAWDGTSNIIVDMIHNGANATNNSITYYTDTAATGNTVAYSATASTNTASFSTQRLNATFAGNATPAITNYSWATTTTPGTAIGTGNNLSVSPSVTTNYVATLTAGDCTIASSQVTVTVSPASVGGTIAADQTICSGTAPASLVLTGNTGAVTKWQKALTADFASATDIASPSTTLSGVTIGNLTATTYFRAVVQSGSCTSANSTYATITVSPVSVGGTLSSQAICSGSQPADLTLNGYTGVVVKWQSSATVDFASPTDIISTATTLSGTIIGNLTTTTYFRAVVQSSPCSIANSTPATITIGATTWTVTAGVGSWNNGAPTSATSAIIAGNYTSAGDLSACSLTVYNNATVVVNSGDDFYISGSVDVNANSSLTFSNNANLIQSGSTNTNTGAVVVKRNSSPLMRLDYTLWSSPVASQNLLAFSPLTTVSPTVRFLTYNSATNFYTNMASPSTTNFNTAQGYLIRMPNTHPTTATVWSGQFSGVPNNGNYSFTMHNGGAGFRYNLVGNPYPSPINADAFFLANKDGATARTTGAFYFWRKTNGTQNSTYSIMTALGGFASNGQPQIVDPQGIIQTGQGFFVEALGNSTVLNFTNSMRVGNNANQFFRSANIEKNRFWLNATNSAGLYSQALVGYITTSTLGVDAGIDGRYINDGDIALSSTIDNEQFAIQGRPLPFDANDVVPLNFKVVNSGTYSIAIDHVDGFFTTGQTIYLKDNLTNTVHDLSASAYSFASDAGTFSNRFEIVYQNPLAVNPVTFNANNVVVYKQNQEIVINTGKVIMSSVKVFDIRGRLLAKKNKINATETKIYTGTTNEVLLVQITSDTDGTVTKKVIN